MVKIGACAKPVRTYDVGAPSAITISLPGMDPADAERRRFVCYEGTFISYWEGATVCFTGFLKIQNQSWVGKKIRIIRGW